MVILETPKHVVFLINVNNKKLAVLDFILYNICHNCNSTKPIGNSVYTGLTF
jgi:hypothetical protein